MTPTKRTLTPLFILLILSSCHQNKKTTKPAAPYISSAEILNKSSQQAWREPDPENTLYIELKSGTVIAELATELTPNHTKNTKALIRDNCSTTPGFTFLSTTLSHKAAQKSYLLLFNLNAFNLNAFNLKETDNGHASDERLKLNFLPRFVF